jgi:hypothetical protein
MEAVGRRCVLAVCVACGGCSLLVSVDGLVGAPAAPPSDASAETSQTASDADASEGGVFTLAAGDVRVYAGRRASPQAILSRTRLAGQSTWSPATVEISLGGEPRFVVPVFFPSADEVVAIQWTNGAQSQLDVRRRAANGWTTELAVSTLPLAHADKRAFDLEREDVSGDGLVVYSIGTSVPVYRTRASGGSWTPETAVPLGGPTTGAVIWVDLVSRRATNEITLAFSTENNHLYVQTWDGAAWDTQTFTRLETNLNSTHFLGFALAYEDLSGDLVAVWGRSQSAWPYVTPWALRSSGSKTFAATQTIHATLPAPMGAVSERGSDRIAFVWEEDTCLPPGVCDDFVAATWTGAGWNGVSIVDPDIGTGYKQRVGSTPTAVGWLNGDAIAVYASTNPVTSGLRWTRWSGGAWAARATATMSPGLGDQVSYAVVPPSSPQQGLVFVIGDTQKIWARATDGSGWWNADNGAPFFDFGVSLGSPIGVLSR